MRGACLVSSVPIAAASPRLAQPGRARVGEAQKRRLGDQRDDVLPVSGIDALQPVDAVEGAVGRQDRVDAAVDRERGENGVTGVEVSVNLEQVDSALNIIWLDGVPPGKLGDVSRRLSRAAPIPGAACSLVHELLE